VPRDRGQSRDGLAVWMLLLAQRGSRHASERRCIRRYVLQDLLTTTDEH
jgi:hypothetical protein